MNQKGGYYLLINALSEKSDAPSASTNPQSDIDLAGTGLPTFKSTQVTDTDPYALSPKAEETLGGATSAAMNQSSGQPGSGMSSRELHHNGHSSRKKEHAGADQWGQNKEHERANDERY
jgi:hypothetical protein